MGEQTTATSAKLLRVYEDRRLVYTTDLDKPLELGRQRRNESAPYSRIHGSDKDRVIIAGSAELSVSRKHALLEPGSDGQVIIRNLSTSSAIVLQDGGGDEGMQDTIADVGHIGPTAVEQAPIPVLLLLGNKTIRIEEATTAEDDLSLTSLEQATQPPSLDGGQGSALADAISEGRVKVSPEEMVKWLRASASVLELAANSPDFFAAAVRTVAEMVGLDCAAAFLWDDAGWRVAHRHSTKPSSSTINWEPSHTMLNRVRSEKKTFWHVPDTGLTNLQSLANVNALVAAPILDHEGEVVGVIYGDRSTATAEHRPITEVEALVVELLASGVAAGLARVEQERAALKARVQFEQFFSTELARQLEAEPDLLDGKEADISVMFCDIRGFSRISERVGPATTMTWVRDVLEAMSDCVIRHKGVLVDYIGDELMAMWGAPIEQPDHAALACRAGLEMLEQLPALNQRWSAELGEPVRVGIGVSSGVARVGNTGSSRKFKYGPLGNTVNLASRVQGATKYAQLEFLITATTAQHLAQDFSTRRICRVRVVNIEEPIDLFEVATDPNELWRLKAEQYEAALTAFEANEFALATSVLAKLVADYPDDGPTRLLLSRAVAALNESPEEFETVWSLTGK